MITNASVQEQSSITLTSDSVNLFKNFSKGSTNFTEATPEDYTVPVSTTIPVVFGTVTTARIIFITTDQPITLRLTGSFGLIVIPITDYFNAHIACTAISLQNLSPDFAALVKTLIIGV